MWQKNMRQKGLVGRHYEGFILHFVSSMMGTHESRRHSKEMI